VVVAGYARALMPALYAQAQAWSARRATRLHAGARGRACGTRVLVADTPELREAGGEHAIVVEPSFEGLREGLRRAVDLRPLVEPGLAERSSWRRRATLLAARLAPRYAAS
jgi:hypothetical protein